MKMKKSEDNKLIADVLLMYFTLAEKRGKEDVAKMLHLGRDIIILHPKNIAPQLRGEYKDEKQLALAKREEYHKLDRLSGVERASMPTIKYVVEDMQLVSMFDLHKPTVHKLNLGEKRLVEYIKGMSGKFYSNLFNAMFVADSNNLLLLAQGYKEEADAVFKWQNVPMYADRITDTYNTSL
jgi:hypothetical protein